MQAAVARSRELHSDFLGFGDILYRSRPDVWDRVKGKWREEWLPNLEVAVSVHCHLNRSGTTIDALRVKLQ